MKGTIKIKIDKKITEEMLLENCLNLYHSGYEYRHLLAFYSIAKPLKFDTLIDYINLIENTK